jgi:hypothetical protein
MTGTDSKFRFEWPGTGDRPGLELATDRDRLLLRAPPPSASLGRPRGALDPDPGPCLRQLQLS